MTFLKCHTLSLPARPIGFLSNRTSPDFTADEQAVLHKDIFLSLEHSKGYRPQRSLVEKTKRPTHTMAEIGLAASRSIPPATAHLPQPPNMIFTYNNDRKLKKQNRYSEWL